MYGYIFIYLYVIIAYIVSRVETQKNKAFTAVSQPKRRFAIQDEYDG